MIEKAETYQYRFIVTPPCTSRSNACILPSQYGINNCKNTENTTYLTRGDDSTTHTAPTNQT